MSVYLLVNPAAGRGKGDRLNASIVNAVRSHCENVEVLSASSVEETSLLMQSAVDRGAEKLIVAGGDGIVHLAIQAVAGSSTVLGIIPSGSGNDFARAVGLPTGIEEASKVALSQASKIDLLKVDNRWVASVLTFGFSADVNTRADKMRRPKGPSRYTFATLFCLPKLQGKSLEFLVDDRRYVFDLILGTVANTSDFGGGMKIAPDADPADGKSNLTLVADIGRIELLRFFRRVFDGSHLLHPKVHTLEGKVIDIISEGFDIWGDGELVAVSPIRIELAPQALLLAKG